MLYASGGHILYGFVQHTCMFFTCQLVHQGRPTYCMLCSLQHGEGLIYIATVQHNMLVMQSRVLISESIVLSWYYITSNSWNKLVHTLLFYTITWLERFERFTSRPHAVPTSTARLSQPWCLSRELRPTRTGCRAVQCRRSRRRSEGSRRL